MLHTFLLFGCILAPVKYYGSRLGSPITSIITGTTGTTGTTGILEDLGILGTPQPALDGLLGLTSSTALSNATSQAQKLHPIQRTPTQRAGLLGLTSSNRTIQRNEPSPETPALLRPAADLPRPSADGSQRPGYAPPAQPHWQIYAKAID